MKRYLVTVIENIAATPTVNLIRFKLKEGEVFEFKAGQFISIFIDKDGSRVVRPYSISSSPKENGQIEICVKKVEGGYASNYLSNIKPGTELMIFGPNGHFNLHEPIDSDVVFVATGSGISPFKPMIETLLDMNLNYGVWLFFGVRNEEEIIYRKELEELTKKHKNFHLIIILSRPSDSWNGERGHVQDAIKKYVTDTKNKHIYICGIKEMVLDVVRLSQEMGFDNDKIHTEKYN